MTFGKSQLEHGNWDDSRKKCHVALLGLLVAPLGRTHWGLGTLLQLTPIHPGSFPNFSSDVNSCHFVWVLETQIPSAGDSMLVSENQGMSQSSRYFAPVAQLIPSSDAGSMLGGTGARHPSVQSMLN